MATEGASMVGGAGPASGGAGSAAAAFPPAPRRAIWAVLQPLPQIVPLRPLTSFPPAFTTPAFSLVLATA